MPDFTTKMMTARSIALGEKDKTEAAQELGVAVSTVEGWVRSYKTAAVQEKARVSSVKAATPKKAPTKAKKEKAKITLPEPEKVVEPAPTKPTAPPAPVADKTDEDDFFF